MGEKLVSMRIDLPEDVHRLLLEEQAKVKQTRKIGMFSLQSTAIMLLREVKRLRSKQDNFEGWNQLRL